MRILGDKRLNEAFDGDFGEVAFDHKPTSEDIFLVKLKLVAQAQLDAVVEWGEEECPHHNVEAEQRNYDFRRECPECWAELKEGEKG